MTDVERALPNDAPQAESPDAVPLVVIMGVSGAGKTTVGELLAAELGVNFVDGDTLHSPANLILMAAGQPLSDGDRWPWLELVGEVVAEASETGVVVACSALRRVYRDAILRRAPGAQFVLLDGSREILAARLAARAGHFMSPELLESQLATLEYLGDDEPGLTIDVGMPAAEIARRIAAR